MNDIGWAYLTHICVFVCCCCCCSHIDPCPCFIGLEKYRSSPTLIWGELLSPFPPSIVPLITSLETEEECRKPKAWAPWNPPGIDMGLNEAQWGQSRPGYHHFRLNGPPLSLSPISPQERWVGAARASHFFSMIEQRWVGAPPRHLTNLWISFSLFPFLPLSMSNWFWFIE